MKGLTQGNEIRRERLNLAHEEAPETIKVLNQFLLSINEELESSLKVPSTIASRESAQVSRNKTAPTISEVESEHNSEILSQNERAYMSNPDEQFYFKRKMVFS